MGLESTIRLYHRGVPLRVVLFTLPGVGETALAVLRAAGHDVPAVVLDPHDAASSASSVAREAGAEVLSPDRLDDPAFLARLGAAAPDVVAVSGFDRRIPEAAYALAARAALNVHPSLLPRYRGHNPYFWVLARGETRTGVSIHRITRGFDEGPVVRQVEVPLRVDETLGTLYAALVRIGARLLVETLAALEADGGLPASAQPPGDYPRAPRVRPEIDCRLDWRRPAADLERLVRASNPFYGATGLLLGVPVQVWEASTAPSPADSAAAPGDIFARDGRLAIATGEGALLPHVVGVPGEFIGSVEAFVRRCSGSAGA